MATSRQDATTPIDVASDGTEFKIDGTGVTATAAELNALDGITATVSELNILDGVTATAAEVNLLDGVTATTEELNMNDLSAKSRWFSDFHGDTLPAEIATTAGSGTGNAAAIGPNGNFDGLMYLQSSSADGAFTANATGWELPQAIWRPNKGGLVLEARVLCTDISEAYIFIGFTDQAPSAGLEQPLYLASGDVLAGDATDAVGMLYDVDADTDEWMHGGIKAGAATTPAFAGSAPSQTNFQVIRVEVSSAGAVTGYVNGTAVGSAVANAVTASANLRPAIIVANRSANAVILRLDYVMVEGTRA